MSENGGPPPDGHSSSSIPPVLPARFENDEANPAVTAEVASISPGKDSEVIVDAELVTPAEQRVNRQSNRPANQAIEFLEPDLVQPEVVTEIPDQGGDVNTKKRSLVFRAFGAVGTFFQQLFGIASIIFLVAFAANIPIVQFLSFGYLLEVSGRLARGQKFRDAMIGLKKATVIGGIVLGTWLTLLPIRLISEFWLEAFLIDPMSTPTRVWRVLQIVSIALALLHIATAWMSGGKLRYFFWPFIAPVSFGIWLFKKTAGNTLLRPILGFFLNWISPTLVDDICEAKPIKDWFPPAIIWKRIKEGNLYGFARDRVWDFTSGLNLPYYLSLGFKGFLGTLAWLFIPTALLVTTSYSEGGVAILSGLFGTLFAIPVFALLPFIQAHFAKDGKLKRFIEVRAVFKNFGRAPLAHFVALLMTLVLALPLFLLKIEQIPSELLWTLSVVFVVFSWPARMIVGWAYRRGTRKEQSSRWWVRYPIVSVMLPVSLAFVLILTLTRYISWYGALSLFENHVFLLPAPFWL